MTPEVRKRNLSVVADYVEELGLDDGETVLWMVMGTEGNYSDRREWPVAVYFTEEQAKAHAAAAEVEENRLREEWLAEDSTRERWEWRNPIDFPAESKARWANVFDAELGNDAYGDTAWFTCPVRMRKALPRRPD